jgi:hypothetical protein
VADYSRQLASAQRQIRAKGDLVQYQPIADAVVNNPAQPWKVGNLTPSGTDPNAFVPAIPVYAVFVDAQSRGSSTQGMVAEFVHGTDVIGGNKMALIAGGLTFTPRVNDLIIRGGFFYKVGKIKTVDPGGLVLLWKLNLEIGVPSQPNSLEPFLANSQLAELARLVNIELPDDIT